MTLREQLKEIPQELIVKLGMEGGSSFVFIGKAADLDLDYLNRMCETAINTAYVNSRKKYLDLLGKAKSTNILINVEDQIARCRGKLALKLPRKNSSTAVVKWLESVERAYNIYADCKRHAESYKAVADREVIDIFKGFESGHPTVIMIEGYEVGKLWMIGEEQYGV